jgi:hypothetical protein
MFLLVGVFPLLFVAPYVCYLIGIDLMNEPAFYIPLIVFVMVTGCFACIIEELKEMEEAEYRGHVLSNSRNKDKTS